MYKVLLNITQMIKRIIIKSAGFQLSNQSADAPAKAGQAVFAFGIYVIIK